MSKTGSNNFEAYVPEVGMIPIIYYYDDSYNGHIVAFTFHECVYKAYGSYVLDVIPRAVLIRLAAEHHEKVLALKT